MSLTFNAMDIFISNETTLVKTWKYRWTIIYFLGFYKKKFEFSFWICSLATVKLVWKGIIMDICHDHKLKFVGSPWNSAFIDTFCFFPNSTAKHEVLNGDCLNVIWSCMLLLVTKDWNTDPQVLLAGLSAWQLSSKIKIKKTLLKITD